MLFSSKSKGFYDPRVHSDIPDDAIEIKKELYLALLEGQASGKLIDSDQHGNPLLVEPPISPATRRLSACTAIDSAAGAARTRFASDSAFIETEYQRAYDTATAWINSGYQGEVPAPVKSDAEAFGRNELDSAHYIKTTGDYWFSKLDEIRDIRLKGKQAVEQSPDEADFMSVAQPFIEQLEALKPQQ